GGRIAAGHWRPRLVGERGSRDGCSRRRAPRRHRVARARQQRRSGERGIKTAPAIAVARLVQDVSWWDTPAGSMARHVIGGSLRAPGDDRMVTPPDDVSAFGHEIAAVLSLILAGG